MVLLLLGYVLLQTRVLNTRTSVTTVGFTGPAQVFAQPLKDAAHGLGLAITIQHVSSQVGGESQVRSGHLDVLVSGSIGAPQVLVKDQLNATLEAALRGLVKQEALAAQLASHGLNPRAVAAAVASATIHPRAQPHTRQTWWKAAAGARSHRILALVITAVTGQLPAHSAPYFP